MIEVEHLSKIYGSTTAIEDVNFSVEKGEILGFLGPNGAGKTTTMRILTGYLPATQGTARIAGFDVHENSMAVRQRIGYLPETPPLYPEMTVEGFLHFVARIKGVSAGDRPNRVQSALSRCNLEEKRHVLIRKLSKGFRQRVGIAQAIVHDPPAIILDEPTVGLDPRQIIDVRNLIKSLAGDHTIILSTHILPEVSMTCNRVTIINQGRVVATNTPDQLVAQLAGGLRYELEVEGHVDTVQERLHNLPGMQSLKTTPLTEEDVTSRYKITMELAPGSDPGRDIAAIVVGAGLGLYEMRRTQVSLEDVFLQLTTEEKVVATTSSEFAEPAELELDEEPSDGEAA
ncbi:ABC transporter ATP-binding protein [Oscillatoria sp. FACHB-1407]|uniref:ABC transporter ATP-binding protein n=1 Tax=Oscillatoria sp. FACHB-1407 TaxID=2692847 RepID=UPI00168A2746|nr:ABC transporter ATP-binding protein [Oscillatoria sp. FACHB-1407]MBD2464405.1 ABC transporter ATP-binding protein [Oscillatoria sp. FACHB-1407]